VSRPVVVIVSIYVAWAAVALVAFLLGAPASIMGSFIGAPIGWTIGIFLIAAWYRVAL
jgi:hypothetical protein